MEESGDIKMTKKKVVGEPSEFESVDSTEIEPEISTALLIENGEKPVELMSTLESESELKLTKESLTEVLVSAPNLPWSFMPPEIIREWKPEYDKWLAALWKLAK